MKKSALKFLVSTYILSVWGGVSVFAADVLPVQKTTWSLLKKHFSVELSSENMLVSQSGELNTLKLLRKHRDKKQVTHYRFEQQYDGVKVLGGQVIVHTRHSEQRLLQPTRLKTMNGKVYEKLEKDLGPKPDDYVVRAEEVLTHFIMTLGVPHVETKTVKPVVYIDKKNKAHWAYQVSVFISGKEPKKPSAILDARSMKPYMMWNDLKTTSRHAFGKGYGGNQKTGKVAYGKGLPFLEITRSTVSQVCYMKNKEVRVIDMENDYFPKTDTMMFFCKNRADGIYWTGKRANGYDKINGAFSPSNDALYAGYIVKHLYKDWYDLEVLENPDHTPMQLVMRVHYGDAYENAYWDGNQMTFGDGGDFLYPLVSLGISAHEISHGFTEQHSDLVYYGQSGGLNESFSDMASIAAEFYVHGKVSWMIGSSIIKPTLGLEALRYLDLPSKDGMSIDSAVAYDEELDVHFSSGVYNRLYYLMSTQADWDPKKAFDVMVKANMDYWTSDETFDTAACGVLNAAKDLDMMIDGIKASMDSVALNYTDCEVMPLS